MAILLETRVSGAGGKIALQIGAGMRTVTHRRGWNFRTERVEFFCLKIRG